MATTANYGWIYPSENEDPYFASFVSMITSIDAEMYIRTKDLYMGGHKLFGNSTSAGDLLLHSTSHATKGKIYFGASYYFDEVNSILYMPTIKGGVGSGGNLTLSSTAHATKGKVYFGATDYYDEVNSVMQVSGFKLVTSPTAGHVLTSNAVGVGTWQVSPLAPSILTGTLSDGETIPLPDGYTEGQCKWIVSVKSFSTGEGNTLGWLCSADGTRIVTCWHITNLGQFSGTANYMIIGIK